MMQTSKGYDRDLQSERPAKSQSRKATRRKMESVVTSLSGSLFPPHAAGVVPPNFGTHLYQPKPKHSWAEPGGLWQDPDEKKDPRIKASERETQIQMERGLVRKREEDRRQKSLLRELGRGHREQVGHLRAPPLKARRHRQDDLLRF